MAVLPISKPNNESWYAVVCGSSFWKLKGQKRSSVVNFVDCRLWNLVLVRQAILPSSTRATTKFWAGHRPTSSNRAATRSAPCRCVMCGSDFMIPFTTIKTNWISIQYLVAFEVFATVRFALVGDGRILGNRIKERGHVLFDFSFEFWHWATFVEVVLEMESSSIRLRNTKQ